MTVALFSLYALFIALGSPIGFWYWFNPSRPAIFAYFIWGRVSVNTPGDMQLPVWNDVLATIGLGLGQVAVVGAALYGWLRWQARRA